LKQSKKNRLAINKRVAFSAASFSGDEKRPSIISKQPPGPLHPNWKVWYPEFSFSQPENWAVPLLEPTIHKADSSVYSF